MTNQIKKCLLKNHKDMIFFNLNFAYIFLYFSRWFHSNSGWLGRNNFVYNNSAAHWMMVFPRQTISSTPRLQLYTRREAVICFDYIRKVIDASHSPLHFAFIGDSRARQLFYNFLKVTF